MCDHYEFSGDRMFLRHQAYPATKEAAEFLLDTLVEAPSGTPFAGMLVTSPSFSPENQYVLHGDRAHLSYATTMDLEIVNDLFTCTSQASTPSSFDAWEVQESPMFPVNIPVSRESHTERGSPQTASTASLF